jgi:hypothetical protein
VESVERPLKEDALSRAEEAREAVERVLREEWARPARGLGAGCYHPSRPWGSYRPSGSEMTGCVEWEGDGVR